MAQLLVLTSTIVCFMAVFFTLDSFGPARARLGQNVPAPVVNFFQEVQTTISSWVSQRDRLLTKEELAQYTGENEGPVYLGILGSVYDVTRGKKHYGPGGGYSFFSGRDGSRAFVTGDFTDKGLTDDVSGFTNAEVLSLEEWKRFYSKDYTYVGKLVGNFYDSHGKPTAAQTHYQKALEKALAAKKAEDAMMQVFPPCNSQWSQGGHTRVWCTNRSGGIQRDWVGVPRRYFQPGKDKPQCVCVRNSGPPYDAEDNASHNNQGDLGNPNLKLYDGCDVNADSCSYVKTDN